MCFLNEPVKRSTFVPQGKVPHVLHELHCYFTSLDHIVSLVEWFDSGSGRFIA